MDSKKCQICSYSKTTKLNLTHFELKIKYDLCERCKTCFQLKLKDELKEFAKKVDVISDDCNIGWKRLFYDICKKYNDSTDILQQINDLINKIYQDVFTEIKYKKPFNQCTIYNYNGVFHGYTTLKQMHHAIKFNKATKISDSEIKWNFVVEEKIEDKYHFNYSRNKENVCLSCGKKDFLDTFSILPKDKINEYEGEGINIHFYHAVCSSCKDHCTAVKEQCGSSYLLENGNNICDHINLLIANKEKDKLSLLIKNYNEKYKSNL
jgi:hypothetical protein